MNRPIAKLEDNLWTVDGDIRVPGGSFIRKMTLIRLGDGRIVIHSAIAVEQQDLADIERWGEPAFCIVPNRRHRLDAPVFRRRYPAIKIICPAAIRRQVEKVVSIDGGYELLPPEIEWRTLATKDEEAAFISRRGERARASAIFGDVLFNVPHFKGMLGHFFRLIGSTGGPRVTPLAKRVVVADRKLLSSQLRELAALPGLTRLIPGHGTNIENDAVHVLIKIADEL